jgi:hypothetical protein
MPKAKEIVLEKFEISISYDFSEGMDLRKPKFETNAWIFIEVSKKEHIDKLLSIAYHIRNFLSLGVGDKISILAIEGKIKNTEEYKRIQISCHIDEEISEEKVFLPPFMPFQYISISKHPEFYLKNWFNIAGNFEPTYDLFFGTMYNPHLYATNEFLSLVQAIESYQSRTINNDVLPQNSFSEQLSQILNVINGLPKKYREHFQIKAKCMNRKSLREMMKELFEKYEKFFKPFINDKTRFIRKIVDTRNYYTHYDKNSERNVVKPEYIPLISQKLQFILIIILLKEIGFEDEFVVQALQRYMRFRTIEHIF